MRIAELKELKSTVQEYMKAYDERAGYLSAALVGGAYVTRSPAAELLTPSIGESALLGMTISVPLVHSGGLHFAGMFGYRTGFAGVQNMLGNLTIGNAALSSIQAVGRQLYNRGIKSTFTAWAAAAREVGLTGYTGRVILDELDDVTLKRMLASGQLNLKEALELIGKERIKESLSRSKFTRILGGQGNIRSMSFLVKEIEMEGKRALSLMPKLKIGNVVMGGKWAARLGTAVTAYSWLQLLSAAIGATSDKVTESFSENVRDLHRFVSEQRTFSMGRGYLGPSFQNQIAATERQRAIQAIYASRINPRSRVMGNEASMYHR